MSWYSVFYYWSQYHMCIHVFLLGVSWHMKTSSDGNFPSRLWFALIDLCYERSMSFLAPTSDYPCTPGYCGPKYGELIIGSSWDLARACTNDHPRCKAYQYSPSRRCGYLCSSKTTIGNKEDFQNCVKPKRIKLCSYSRYFYSCY